MYSSIVVGNDGSATAWAAMVQAAALAKAFEAPLHVVCAYQAPVTIAASSVMWAWRSSRYLPGVGPVRPRRPPPAARGDGCSASRRRDRGRDICGAGRPGVDDPWHRLEHRKQPHCRREQGNDRRPPGVGECSQQPRPPRPLRRAYCQDLLTCGRWSGKNRMRISDRRRGALERIRQRRSCPNDPEACGRNAWVRLPLALWRNTRVATAESL